jgi:hypothetical protein
MQPRDTLRIAGVPFKIAKDGKGVFSYAQTHRASQPGDPGGMAYAEWRVDGPDLFSYESNDYLGREYGVGTDGRWDGVDCLGPLINTITLSTYDVLSDGTPLGSSTARLGSTMMLGGAVTVDDADGQAVVQASGKWYAYITRGMIPAKVDLSDMGLDYAGVTLPAPATSIITTKNPTVANRREVSIGLGESAPYRVVKEDNIGVHPNGDSWVANNGDETARIFGIAPDRTVLITDKTVKGNIQTGAVTMTDPVWNTVATLSNLDAVATGFGLDGPFWTIGTSLGPAFLDKDTAEFTLLMPEIDYSTENCRNMAPWFDIGLVVPLQSGVRYMRSGQGRSWGVENFSGNASPVQGYPTGGDGSTRWYLQAVYDTIGGDTYLVAWHPREPDARHPHPYSPHTIAKLTGTECRYIDYIGTAGGVRTNPTWMGGYGSNAFYFTGGRLSREIDDTNYRFASSGTTYLTELRRQPSVLKDIEVVELETEDCAIGSTVDVYLSVDGATAVQVGETVETDGFHRLVVTTETDLHGGRFIKPEIRYATDSSSTSPKVRGSLRMRYRTRPRTVGVYNFTVELEETNFKTGKELHEHLVTQLNSGPVSFTDGPEQLDTYVRIDSVKVVSPTDSVGGDTSSRGFRKYAQVEATAWEVE